MLEKAILECAVVTPRTGLVLEQATGAEHYESVWTQITGHSLRSVRLPLSTISYAGPSLATERSVFRSSN